MYLWPGPGAFISETDRRGILTGFIFAEDSENFLELVFLITIIEFLVHHHAELGELQVSTPINIHLVDHVLNLGLGRILTCAAHRSVKFLKERTIGYIVILFLPLNAQCTGTQYISPFPAFSLVRYYRVYHNVLRYFEGML